MDNFSVVSENPSIVATHETSARAKRLRRRIAFALAAGTTLAIVGLVCWTFRGPWFSGNLAVVDPGRVIRSAQPTDQLNRWIEQYGLRSILNLRGGGSADDWYRNEVNEARSHDVAFYDLPLSATRRPKRRELLILIDLLDRCRYPLLIHCKSGADRTGLASAIYEIVRLGTPPLEAERALSLDFGHVPILGPEHLHEPLREYAAWLKANGLPHQPARFREWVRNEYQAPDPPADPPVLQPGPRIAHRALEPAERQ